MTPNVHEIKRIIAKRMKIAEPGPGRMHMPSGLSPRYSRELTAERLINGDWVRSSRATFPLSGTERQPMSFNLILIRIDPVARSIVKLRKFIGNNATPEIRRLLRASRTELIGHHQLLDVDAVPLIAAGKIDVDESMRGWRLQGCEDHAGIGILFGKGPTGGMTNCPVSVDWVKKRIVWMEGEDPIALQERAEALAPSLPDEIAQALRRATDGSPLAAGATMLWLPAADAEHFPAMIQLGLGDESTGGQRLTRLGGAVRELVTGAGA